MDSAPVRPSSPSWRRATQTTNGPLTKEARGNDLPSLQLSEIKNAETETMRYDVQPNGPETASTPLMASPPTIYSGPPPPYTYPSSTASASVSLTAYASSPDSRRMSDDDKNSQRSLPSIHEALGKDHRNLYPSTASLNTQANHAIQSNTTLSPTTQVPRSHPGPTLAGTPNLYASQPLPPYSSEPIDRRPQAITQQSQAEPNGNHANRQVISQENGHATSKASAAQTSAPPVRQSPYLMHPPSQPTQPFPPSSQPSQPPPPPPSQPTIGNATSYRPHGPSYSFPPPPQPAYPNYQSPQPQQPHWRPDGPEIDRAEQVRKAAAKGEPGGDQHYSESVKRHLDIFDFDMSINEIAEGCRRGLEFTQYFAHRAHQSQRTGPNISSMPTVAECDDLIRRHQLVINSMARIKDVVIAQHNALAEQRSREEANKSSKTEYRDESNLYLKDSESAGGFPGADSKRRRGRNAAPGRCHSCNRAETPEWRRGPDGARTLCNACGLHYAKLTRKMGNKAHIGSSNLRPKESGSP